MKYAGKKNSEKRLPQKTTNSTLVVVKTHEHGVGFLIHKDTVNAMKCRPVSSRLITSRLKASPFNITIIQAYAPTTNQDDDDIKDFYDQLQEAVDQTPPPLPPPPPKTKKKTKKDIILVQDDWNAKTGEDASKHWKGICDQYCNPEMNERSLRLIEF